MRNGLMARGEQDAQCCYLGSDRKMDTEAARQKARRMKEEALGYCGAED